MKSTNKKKFSITLYIFCIRGESHHLFLFKRKQIKTKTHGLILKKHIDNPNKKKIKKKQQQQQQLLQLLLVAVVLTQSGGRGSFGVLSKPHSTLFFLLKSLQIGEGEFW